MQSVRSHVTELARKDYSRYITAPRRAVEFVIMFVLPFGFVFELPLVITILGKLGFITSKFLSKYARIVIFLSFVIAAVISPTPDVFTQSMIAVPMIALYGVGYLIVRFILRK